MGKPRTGSFKARKSGNNKAENPFAVKKSVRQKTKKKKKAASLDQIDRTFGDLQKMSTTKRSDQTTSTVATHPDTRKERTPQANDKSLDELIACARISSS